jgi:HK97 gp10 family phage protein
MAVSRTFRMELRGAKELEAALRELPKRIGKAAIRRALKKVAQPIAEDAKARVAVSSGRLQRRIQVATTLSKRQRRSRARGADPNRVDVYIGAAPARHAHLVEFGSGPRRHKKTRKSVGTMPAQPFLRPAWDAGKHQALDQLERLLWQEIDKAARALRRRLAKAGL